MKRNISRRDFLKLFLMGLSVFLASCLPRELQDPLLTDTPLSTNTPTKTAEPSPTVISTPTETPAPSQTPTNAPSPEGACLKLLTPEDGSSLPGLGKVTFTWTAVSQAAKYQVHVTNPSGKTLSFETANPSLTLYLESFQLSGRYIWKVEAVDGSGALLCASGVFAFEKPAQASSATEPAQGREDEGTEDEGTEEGSDDWDDDWFNVDG